MIAARWLAAFLLCGAVHAYAAQPYPTKPVRLVIPYPPGGPTDFVGRLVGQKLSPLIGQQVVVDNRPGAGTIIGSEIVLRAAPDGYTLLFGTGGGTFLAPLMLPKVPYDPHRDFARGGGPPPAAPRAGAPAPRTGRSCAANPFHRGEYR